MTCDKWGILVPEATTNLVTNPSFETGTTGWAAAAGTGGTVTPTRVAAAARRGAYGIQLVITYGSAVNRYIMGENGGTGAFAASAGTSYTASIDFYTAAIGSAAVTFYMSWFTSAPAFISNSAAVTITTAGAWTRATITATAPATTALGTLNVSVDTAGITCYIDGAQVEAKAYATSYVDGDLGEGYAWTGTAHASTSTRTAQARSGGREYMIESGYGLTARYMSGIGMPPIRQLVQPRALLPGAHYSGYHVDPRSVTLLIAAANNASLSALHDMRALLVNALKPDLVSPDDQPITLRYYGSNSTDPAELYCYYEAGLDFQQPEYYKFDQIPLRLIAYDPYWYKQGSRAAALTTSQTLAMSRIVANEDGAWINMNGGVTNGTIETNVYSIAGLQGKGSLFVGGEFTTAGSTSANRIATWDGSMWARLTSTGADATVRAILPTPGGGAYVGGAFTAIGATSADYVALWNGSSFTSVGSVTALNGAVNALTYDRDGRIIAGGAFTTAGGVAAADRIAAWNGSAWSALGGGIPNGTVFALAVAADGGIIAAGTFSTAGSTASKRIAKYNGTTWETFNQGIDGTAVYALAVSEDNQIYAGGDFTWVIFTTAGADPEISFQANNLARWNGTTWNEVSDGANNAIYALKFDGEKLFVGGAFSTVGKSATHAGVAVDGIATWNGSTWRGVNVTLPATALGGVPDVYSIAEKDGNYYFGFVNDQSANGETPALTSVTNSGSARAYPVIKIKRSGGTTATIRLLKNVTTGATINLEYSLIDGETLTIDTRLGSRSINSDMNGPVWYGMERDSQFSEFYLQPGANSISAYVYTVGSPTVTATVEWKEMHWSADTV